LSTSHLEGAQPETIYTAAKKSFDFWNNPADAVYAKEKLAEVLHELSDSLS